MLFKQGPADLLALLSRQVTPQPNLHDEVVSVTLPGLDELAQCFGSYRWAASWPTFLLAAPREMWEPESYELIPPMDEHGIDERDLAGIDDDTPTLPLRMPRAHPDAARSPP